MVAFFKQHVGRSKMSFKNINAAALLLPFECADAMRLLRGRQSIRWKFLLQRLPSIGSKVKMINNVSFAAREKEAAPKSKPASVCHDEGGVRETQEYRSTRSAQRRLQRVSRLVHRRFSPLRPTAASSLRTWLSMRDTSPHEKRYVKYGFRFTEDSTEARKNLPSSQAQKIQEATASEVKALTPSFVSSVFESASLRRTSIKTFLIFASSPARQLRARLIARKSLTTKPGDVAAKEAISASLPPECQSTLRLQCPYTAGRRRPPPVKTILSREPLEHQTEEHSAATVGEHESKKDRRSVQPPRAFENQFLLPLED